MYSDSKWHTAGRRATPVLKFAGKMVLLTALRYGPAVVAGWAVKSVARRPAKMLLAFALEPLLKKVATRFSARYLQKRPPVSR